MILGKKPGSDELLKSYLYPLLNLGIIDKVKSNIDRRAKIYFPIEEGNIFSLFQDDKDLRLKVSHPSLFPSKDILEKEFRTFVKYYYNHDVPQKTGIKYKIVDIDGTTELSLDELLIKYFNHPEICFKEEYSLERKQQYIAELEQRPISNNLIYTQQLVQKNTIIMVHTTRSNILQQFSNNLVEDSANMESKSKLDWRDHSKAENEIYGEIPSPLCSTSEYCCPFCEIKGIKFEATSLEILETHAVNRHPGCNIFSQPDIEKFRSHCEAKQQKNNEG